MLKPRNAEDRATTSDEAGEESWEGLGGFSRKRWEAGKVNPWRNSAILVMR